MSYLINWIKSNWCQYKHHKIEDGKSWKTRNRRITIICGKCGVTYEIRITTYIIPKEAALEAVQLAASHARISKTKYSQI